jgi:hypothetical protein
MNAEEEDGSKVPNETPLLPLLNFSFFLLTDTFRFLDTFETESEEVSNEVVGLTLCCCCDVEAAAANEEEDWDCSAFTFTLLLLVTLFRRSEIPDAEVPALLTPLLLSTLPVGLDVLKNI